MNDWETASYDESRLSEASRELAAELFTRFPEFEQYAEMERSSKLGEWSLVVTVPSPRDVYMVVCMEGEGLPTVHYREEHWHDGAAGVAEDILELVAGILEDRLVLYYPLKDGTSAMPELVNGTNQTALLDLLTDPHCPDCAELVSWSGRTDRILRLEEVSE